MARSAAGRTALRVLAAGLMAGVALAAAGSDDCGDRTMTDAAMADDRQAILDHIRGIFRAYIERDRDTIRRTHAADWTGFQGPSRQIERGIEAYMRNADVGLEHFRGTDYELLDTEVQLFGDIGIVYYVARYDYIDKEGNAGSLPLRSVDIYRCLHGEWTQIGSHITPIPQGVWGEGE